MLKIDATLTDNFSRAIAPGLSLRAVNRPMGDRKMSRQQTELIVLARIPDLGTQYQNHEGSGGPNGRWKLPGGRWVSQTLSFKLLAGLTLCLLLAAVLPYVLSRSPAPTEPPVASDSLGEWRSDAAKDYGDAKAANRPTPTGATLVRAAPESPPPQRIADRQPSAGDVQSNPADEKRNWSQWPNPHPVEYEADARANGKPQEPGRDGGKQ